LVGRRTAPEEIEMTEILTGAQLRPSASQLPMSWYSDPDIFALEQERIFKRGPGYVGHELMVPNAGDYFTLDWARHGKVLVRGDDGGVRLFNNICRHRQSMLLEGRGNVRNIVCPVHKWTYGLDGSLMGAPEFDQNPHMGLTQTPLTSWHGLLFRGPRDAGQDLAGFPLAHEFDFGGYVFERQEVDVLDYNWKNFLEIFLEMYHVVPFHPGLQYFVDPGNYQWGFGERWSYQILGVKDEFRTQVSPHYTRYRNAILQYGNGVLPKYATLWCILYPNVMLEWYPYSLVISTLVPVTPEQTLNVVQFFYPEEVALFERELVEAHQAAYAESAAEDSQICRWFQKGRRAMYLNREEDVGPYHSPHEDGMVHLHEFLRRELSPPK
jgi:phenylpropionate dioxygenase-like ring-hydroxylating dioxygenase large terminal subunit